jgi:hypothetical protein
MYIFFVAALAYAFSIFIDVSVYHLKYYIQDSKNVRYLLSLINIFQYSARAFVLVFVPIMAYLTEAIKDKHDVWLVTIIAHFFVVISLLPLYSHRFTSMFSLNVILVLNVVFGKSKMINLDSIERHKVNENNDKISKNIFLFVTSYIAGFLFSVSITFLYYLSFSFPQKALILSSLTQIINMFGSLLLVLFIDPRVMTSIDNGSGYYEIKILTTSRILVHITLILILFVI